LRSSLPRALVLVLLGAAAIGAQARAQTEVTTTLVPGGGPLLFAGRVKWPEADRYYVLGRKDARLSARLLASHSRLVLVVVAGDKDPREPQKEWTYADTVDTSFLADGRYAVAVLFDPRVDFDAPPQPASYRLELRMD